MPADDDEKPQVHVRTSINPADFMTDRMVIDRCLRMYRLEQWKRLHDFCAREPRAREWTLRHIAQTHGLKDPNARVEELFNRLLVNRAPRTRVDLKALTLPPELKDDSTTEISDSDVQEAVFEITEAPDPRIKARPNGTADALLSQFILERDENRFVDAARSLLAYVRASGPVVPGGQFPIMAVEFREVASALALEGEFRLLVDLCAALPARITAGALIDMGEKLKLGAQLHEAALTYQANQRAKAGTQKVRDAAFMEAARRVLADG